jgi:response regulator RpfG family c-di-GMP phosphodiesterase
MSEVKTKADTLLIVDDDVRVVELLQITLGGRGYEVLTAYDGDAALQLIRDHDPDLVVLDVRLPRRSGLEVLQTLRQAPETRNLPVVLISANAATESRLQGLKLGADDYVTKPFSPRELILRIRRILDRSKDVKLLEAKNEMLENEVRRGRETLLGMQGELSRNLSRIGGLLGEVLEMNEAAPIEQVLERFVLTAVGTLEFSRIVLLLPAEGELRPRIWRGIPESAVRGLRFTESGFLLRVLGMVERPMRLEELEDYPEGQTEMGRLSAAGVTLVVPAVCGGELYAVLGFGEQAHGRTPGRFEFQILEILGHAVAAGLRNASSFSRFQRGFLDTMARLVASIENRYHFMQGHSRRVAELALRIGRRLGLPDDEIEVLRHGALLHDIGEYDRFGDLIGSPKVLTGEERRRLRFDAARSSETLLGEETESRVRAILAHHRERWDGTGFPDRLRGTDIPLGARIVGLANAWDALHHDRPHRPARSREEALRMLRASAGTQFDPDLVSLLVSLVESEEESPLRS